MMRQFSTSNSRAYGVALCAALILMSAASRSIEAGMRLQERRSEDESRDWLRMMLLARARAVTRLPDGSALENRLEAVSFQDCTLTYTDATRSKTDKQATDDLMINFIVPLADLNAYAINIITEADRTKMVLSTVGGRKTIKGMARRIIWSDTGPPVPISETAYQSHIVIAFDSVEIADQSARVFRQVIKSCQQSAH